MDANNLVLKDEVYRIVGAAFTVLKELGHGLHEKPYENALVVEFGLLGIPYEQQQRFPVIRVNLRPFAVIFYHPFP